MSESHRRKLEEVDGDSIKVHFSPRVKSALADLDAAVHFSEHFARTSTRFCMSGQRARLRHAREVMVAVPLIARHTFEHIRKTGDERADDAWHEFSSQLNENGFKLVKSPLRHK